MLRIIQLLCTHFLKCPCNPLVSLGFEMSKYCTVCSLLDKHNKMACFHQPRIWPWKQKCLKTAEMHLHSFFLGVWAHLCEFWEGFEKRIVSCCVEFILYIFLWAYLPENHYEHWMWNQKLSIWLMWPTAKYKDTFNNKPCHYCNLQNILLYNSK